MDPYLQRPRYIDRVRALTGFAARVRRGQYGREKQVQAGTVIGALMSIGQDIALACGENPTKLKGCDKKCYRVCSNCMTVGERKTRHSGISCESGSREVKIK